MNHMDVTYLTTLASGLGLDELLVVANTRHGPGGHRGVRVRAEGPMHDHLADPADAREFLVTHAVAVSDDPPGPEDLAAMAAVRDYARALAEHETVDDRPVQALFATHHFRVTPDGRLEPARSGWPGFVADLLPPLVELRRLRERLRLCGNPYCRFLFIDRSRNASRVWCDVSHGNRARVERFRHRHGEHAS